MSTVLFTLPQNFSYALAGASCVVAVLHFSGLMLAYARSTTFSASNMENVKRELAATGAAEDADHIPSQAYPDDGNGRFGKALDYYYWAKFNRVVRGYMNNHEQLVNFLVSILLCAVYQPVWAAWIGLGIGVSRLVYFVGYAYINTIVMMIGEVPALLLMFANYGIFLYYLISGN